MTPEEFYSQYLPYAQSVSRRTGLDPRLVLAQAALETGYGKSAPGMNFFGIKSHGRKGGQTLQSSEFQGGQMVSQPASFRTYETPEQSFQDYADFLESNPRYKGVLSAEGLGGQIAEMAKSGYATDPQYGAKLTNIASKFDPNSSVITDVSDMAALNKNSGGILAPQQANSTESKAMNAAQPRGLLSSLGIQRMQEGAEGETGQRFYERESFKDTAATLSQAFAALGGDPAIQKFANNIASQRTEAKARNKTVEYLRQSGRNELADLVQRGMISGADAASQLLATPKDDRTAGIKEYQQAVAQGFKGTFLEYKTALQRASATNISTTIEADGGKKFEEKFADRDANALADVSSVGATASRSLAQIGRLEELLSNIDSGMGASVKEFAGNFGIQTEGLDDIQAANALISALVPAQRPEGSGPMSDEDLKLFKQSLPRIINSPGGNQMIINTMRGLAEYDAEGGRIVQRLRNKDIKRPEAFELLYSRADPFAAFKASIGQASTGGAAMKRWNPSLNNGAGGFE